MVPNFIVPEEVFQIEENGKTAITNYICRLLMACSGVKINKDQRNLGIVDQENIFSMILNTKYPDFDYPNGTFDEKIIIEEEQCLYEDVVQSIRLVIRYEYTNFSLRFIIGKTVHGIQYKCYALYRNFTIQGHNALRDHPIWILKNVSSWFYKTQMIYPFYRQFHIHVEEEKMVKEMIGEISLLEEMKREILSFLPERKWNILMLYGGFKYFSIFIMEGDLSIVQNDDHYATPFLHMMMDLSHPEIVISRFVKPFDSQFNIYENIVERIEEVIPGKIIQLERVASLNPHVILETMKKWMNSHSYQGKYVPENESREGILEEMIHS